MGNSGSCPSSKPNNTFNQTGGAMLQVRPAAYSEQQTINFSRRDLAGTVSELDLDSVLNLNGGGKLELKHAPSVDRYSKYLTTKTMDINANANMKGGGITNTYSSYSGGDLSAIRNMDLAGGSQIGGCDCGGTQTGGSCGCDQNGGFNNFDLNIILGGQIKNDVTVSTSYNPLNSMSELHGGNLTTTSNYDMYSATSDMAGGARQFGGSSLSVTSPMNFSQQPSMLSATSATMRQSAQQGGARQLAGGARQLAGGARQLAGGARQLAGEALSATSPMNFSQQPSMLSATSATMRQSAQQGGALSATSPMNFSQQPSMLSATSATMRQSAQQGGARQLAGGSLSATSPMNFSQQPSMLSATSATMRQSAQQNGGASIYSATSSLENNNYSATSSLPIEYDNLMGGKKNSKKNSSSSSDSTVQESESSSNLLLDDDMNASSSSSSRRGSSTGSSTAMIARALKQSATAHSDKTRSLHRMDSKSHKNSSSSSSSSKLSSSESSMSVSSSNSSMSSSSLGSSSTPNDAIAKVNGLRYNNLVLTSPNSMSGGEKIINVKQFYSSENGDLYSSESNYLKNNITKSRLR